jgi:hypothetical protein
LVLEFFLEFLGIYLGLVWQKNHFYSKQNCQNRFKGVFVKQSLKPNIPQQKKQLTKQILSTLPKTKSIRLPRKH